MNSCTVAYAFYESDFRVRRYAEVLAKRGGRTDAIALRADGMSRTETIKGVRLYRIQRRNFDSQGGPLDYFAKMLLFFIKSSMIILVNHIRNPYKIIIVHNVPDFFVFTAIIPRLTGTKIILDIHDILPELFCERFSKPLNSPYAMLLRIIEKYSVHFSHFVIAGNDLWRRKIAERNRYPVERCIGFINYSHMEYFEGIRHSFIPGRLSIIYPGHLSYHHGVDIAIRAMPTVLARVPQATFSIYASSWIPDYRARLERLIVDLNLMHAVCIHEALTIQELVEVYKSIDIGIVPKRGGFFASEAFSSKILDFMASGIPIVASRTTVDEFYFDDSMIKFFEIDNPADCAFKILDLYENPEKMVLLSDHGRRYAAANTWDIKKKDFEAIVDTLTKE
jgi:glycosyltransferase involved in cell wall biosynthesis